MTDLFNLLSSSDASQPDASQPDASQPTPSTPPIEHRIQYFLDRHASSLSDYGNALRFARQFGHQVRFVPEWGWLLFDGTRWRPDTARTVLALAASSIHSLYDEVRTLTN